MLDEKILAKKYSPEQTAKIMLVQNEVYKNFSGEKDLLEEAEEIAKIVISLKLDDGSVCASILFPFVKAGKLNPSDFSKDAELEKFLKLLLKYDALSKNYTDADGLKSMLLSIAKDIRIMIIKTAEMLVFARKNVQNNKDNLAISAFKSIDDIFAPIAARLGLSEIKSELQDLSFQFHQPEVYENLKAEVEKETRASQKMINQTVEKIKKLLFKNGVECVCYGRIKHLSSIQNKIVNKHYTLKNIYDISAVRILVKSVAECYMALGIVHANFTPVDGRFKDYIANPKPNGYQSLHTTVISDGEFFEVQIRTYDMHDFAEYGVAAHFLYKEHKKSLAAVDDKLLWIRRLLENKENVSSSTLLEELKTDVYLGEIFVQTPMGKVIKLTENATPIDFAYMIHSDVGNKCVGAKVNGQMVSLTSTLSNGDIVEILTSANSKGPSRDWLKKVKMQSTKDKIGAFFRKQMKEENIKLGKSMVEQYAKINDLNLSSLLKDEWIDPILKKNSFATIDELYASIGYGSTTAERFVGRLVNQKQAEEKKQRILHENLPKTPVKFGDSGTIIGTGGTLTKFCKCCNPIPGDDIIGYVSRGRGIIIHKKTCENVMKLPSSRFIPVEWNVQEGSDITFVSFVEIVAKNSNNIYLEITNALSELGVKVVSLNTNQNKMGDLLLKVGIQIKDKGGLAKVINKLSSLSNVYEVK